VSGVTLFAFSSIACGSSGPPDEATYSLRYSLQPGVEEHICQFVQVPESPDGEVFISGRSHDYNAGSHHYGLYRTKLDELPPGMSFDKPEPCWGPDNILQYTTDFIVLEQSPHVDVKFPDGVGLPFKSGEILLLQLHAFNASDVPADVAVDVTLDLMDRSEVEQRMGLLQFYDPYVYLPPLADAEANLRCAIPDDLTMIEANSHFHVRGIDHQAFLDPPDGPRATEPFLRNHDAEHPFQWHGTIPLEAGSHIRFHCKYRNPENRTIIQGQERLENEMCSFWAYAYPEPTDPTVRDCVGPNVDEYGVGNQTCAQTADCIQACAPEDWPDASVPGKFNVGACYQKCIVDSCAPAGALIDRQNQCAARECQGTCPGPGCGECLETRCQAEVAACRSATCE